jgi:hypothetical protein
MWPASPTQSHGHSIDAVGVANVASEPDSVTRPLHRRCDHFFKCMSLMNIIKRVFATLHHSMHSFAFKQTQLHIGITYGSADAISLPRKWHALAMSRNERLSHCNLFFLVCFLFL